MTDFEKVFFFREQLDGYPLEEWESIWAKRVALNNYQIDNIPFYAIGISLGDIIETKELNGQNIFENIVHKSENSTIRVFFKNKIDEENFANKIETLGCEFEKSGIQGLISVNIPKSSIEEFLKTIEELRQNGIIEYEVGVVRK